MTYMPVQPEVREDPQQTPDELRRRRIARRLGLGAVATVALLVGVGA
ncbi:hypothetical protein [Limobrevibacterium gyesilva]|uniref:Uncharacterized protein n=1 Tax=Limobrevibacterium gyesilva TaxID=2991712 RepID=A0AA41YR38_9PROT|nr:hypothetical protein [Limobrevibacterium gyesilva]MCW3474955.1 hypothetical protein [Limobrevibacterium gyesilva]